jgi:ankyrin repeat protein
MPSKSKECARPTDNVDDTVAASRAQDHENGSSSSSGGSSGITTTDASVSSPSPRVESTEEESVIDRYHACKEADTLIVDCVERGDLEGLQRLGQQDARVRSANPLIWCVQHDDPTEFIRFLAVKLGADVNQARADGTTALLIAAQDGNLTMVRCLVGEHGAAVSQSADNGAFPLMMAAENGHLEVLRCLVLEFGADVNQASNADKSTCLSRACFAGDLNVVCCLIELEADVNQAGKEGVFPVHFAIAFEHIDVLRCLIESGADRTEALLAAALEGDVGMLRYLVLELGVDVGQENHNGNFPLLLAATGKWLQALRCLVNELQADVNQASSVSGKTSLWEACATGDLDIVICLVEELGADVNEAASVGRTAAGVAVDYGHTHVLRFLLKAGADEKTAILFAVARGYVGMVRYLVMEFGTDINEDMEVANKAPLIFAAKEGNLDMVRCLVELGASIEIMDGYGNTALLLSAGHGHYATVQFLLEKAGANINAIVDDGGTVWDLITGHIKYGAADAAEEANPAALTSLLRVMVLREDPPPALIALLSPDNTRVVQEGARLRARLPAYLVQRRAFLDAHCPLLPPLCAIVDGYMQLTTEEIWATGLGVAP